MTGEQVRREWLDELAEHIGIEPRFRNAKGEIVETSEETKRRLLAAMGVDAAGELQAQAALEELERAEWLRPLSTAQVLRAGAGAPAIELVLPAGTGDITWHVTLEDGAARVGRVSFCDLELMDTRSVDGVTRERRRMPRAEKRPCHHHLAIEPDDPSMTLIVTPSECRLLPGFSEGRRLWGIAALTRAVHALLARTPSVLAIAQIDDLTDEADPVVVPAASDEHPNWATPLDDPRRTRGPAAFCRHRQNLPGRARGEKSRRHGR